MRSRSFGVALPVVACLLAIDPATGAVTTTPSVGAFNVTPICGSANIVQTASTYDTSCTFMAFDHTSQSYVNGSFDAHGSVGGGLSPAGILTLHTYASMNAENTPVFTVSIPSPAVLSPSLFSRIEYEDSAAKLVAPGVAVGTSLAFLPVFTVTGTISAVSAGTQATFEVLDLNSFLGQTKAFTMAGDYASTVTAAIPEKAGVPFDLGIYFEADVEAGAPSNLYSAAGAVDFSHTAVLTGLLVTDSSGQPVPGAELISSDGQMYSFGTAPMGNIPEPDAIWLLSVGLGGLGVLILRRRVQGRPSGPASMMTATVS